MEQLHQKKILYRDLKVINIWYSLKTLWSISRDIFALEILDCAELIYKSKMLHILNVEVLSIWLMKPSSRWDMDMQLIFTQWEQLFMKWWKESLHFMEIILY